MLAAAAVPLPPRMETGATEGMRLHLPPIEQEVEVAVSAGMVVVEAPPPMGALEAARGGQQAELLLASVGWARMITPLSADVSRWTLPWGRVAQDPLHQEERLVMDSMVAVAAGIGKMLLVPGEEEGEALRQLWVEQESTVMAGMADGAAAAAGPGVRMLATAVKATLWWNIEGKS